MQNDLSQLTNSNLFNEVSQLIEKSQKQVVSYANATLTILFWQVGKKINEDILENQRADYGKQIVSTLSMQLENKYGRSYTEKNLRRMMQFANEFPDYEIVVPLARQLTWSHFLILIPLKSKEAKAYFENKKQLEN